VVHPRKPEWGDGVVRDARHASHQGTAGQRVSVQFANQGRKVINTAVVPLQHKSEADPAGDENETMSSSQTSQSGGWIEQLERSVRGSGNELWDLPDAMTDPFKSLKDQLHATLDAYRFSTEARPLIDWAVMQTGLNDPLSRYTRQELEQAFPGFARNRDQHLKQLVRQLKQAGQTQVLHEAKQTTRYAEAKKALDKAMQE
jgi:hypothetical protein